MSANASSGPYREPPVLARGFVYVFALCAPILTLFVALLPATLIAHLGADRTPIGIAAAVTALYVAILVLCVRGARRVAARFTPPLALPGDIWNIGVAQPPKRSRNWPIRFRRIDRPA